MAEISVKQSWEAIDLQLDNQDSSKSTATVYYIASGSNNENEIIAAALAQIPTSFICNSVSIPIKLISVSERLSEKYWKLEAEYGQDTGGGGGGGSSEEESCNFDISTATKQMVHSLETLKCYPSDADHSAGINDGEGIEVVYPVGRFSITKYLSNAKCSPAYRKKVTMLVGKTNKSGFQGYDKNEVLFLGCQGSRTGDDKWQITYNFAVQSKESNITIGELSGIEKPPWACLWVQYSETMNSKGKPAKKAKAAFVERVYDEGDFGVLSI